MELGAVRAGHAAGRVNSVPPVLGGRGTTTQSCPSLGAALHLFPSLTAGDSLLALPAAALPWPGHLVSCSLMSFKLS